MINIGHSCQETILRGRVLVDWKQAQRIIRRVTKLQPRGFYAEVDELTLEEARLMEKVMPARAVDLDTAKRTKGASAYLVSVYGPRSFVPKLNDRYFVVQLDKEGNPGLSRPMSGKDAWATEPPRDGGYAFVCKVVGVKKLGLTYRKAPADLLHKR